MDIIKFYGINEKKIYVVYFATSLMVPNEKVSLKLPKRYILIVGNRSFYKNFELIFKSVIPILKEDKDLNLVCAGSSRFSGEEMKIIVRENLNERVIHIRFKDGDELAHIYNNALCVVSPSLYEGFGIPILEAFACSCPVVSSNSSSLPEVGGDAVEYFDSRDTESIKETVKKVIDDSKLREKMIEKGKNRMNIFSWKKTVKKYMEIFNCLET